MKRLKRVYLGIVVGCGLLAGARAQDSSSNTVVRFHISTGAGDVGDVDVELFDHDKPQTVRNFLLYFRNGSYNQVLLHRFVPGFVLQGGGFTNSAPPTSTNLFINYGATDNLGTIANEFRFGPRLSNAVGTIAMAKVGNDPNSATSQWFFNLGNNTNLDTQNGGFTVFGRVLSTTNTMAGTNLLSTFNSFSASNGIVNMTAFFGQSWSAFTELPVTYSGGRSPESRELFYVTVSELNGPSEPDTNAPTVAVNFPPPDEIVTNATVTITGTATDDRGVARVLYFFGGSNSTPRVATGTTNWSATLTLNPGRNTVFVQSVDEFGNTSAVLERTFQYFVPPNTVVRFQIFTGDGDVGNVDVELFDREKPETVRNFLLYVRNRSYNQVILHRLVPGFVLQGGGVTNSDAASSSNLFSQFGEIKNLGAITNEFFVGQRLSNTVGTLAMAKLGNNANSASSQWFFNLANNSTNLDAQNGGFTVFGRVLRATNELGETNLLSTFNSLSPSNGIINMASFFGQAWSAFTDLPVNYSGYSVPQSRQLFYATVSELNGPSELDTTPPTIAITSPQPGVIATNANLTLAGTADDDRGVARVIYFFGDTSARVALGDTNWTATLALRPGTNVVLVQSVDRSGNVSPLERRTILYVPSSPIALFVNGNGRITGITNGQVLNVGDIYTAEAKPNPGEFFQGWSGAVASTNARLTFRMQANTTLIATFKPAPFPQGSGTYRGLFVATNRPAQDSVGTFRIAIAPNRRHAGGITYRASNFVFHGLFNAAGEEQLQGTVLGQSITMTLGLNVTDKPSRVAGPVSISGTTAQLEAYRVERRSPTNTLAPAGNYTFLISGSANALPAPGGQGYGTMKLGGTGAISLMGTLGEGTRWKQTSTLLGGDRWPVFSLLYRKGGSILGWSQFETNQPGSFSGNLYWFKPGELTNAYYSSGFTNTVRLRGSRYVPPVAGERVLNWTNGTVLIQGGNLQAPLLIRVALGADDTFTTLSSATPLALAIDRRTGRVNGSFLHPVTQAETPLDGIVVQGFAIGGGLFYGPDQTGSFALQKE